MVQKAFERIPAEHIQFIINSFTGHVQELATHQYGCRVIQRMLENCEEHTRAAVLQEVHASAASLIVDQYGNYVMQHIIEHGLEEDRARTIALVTSQLVNFSKHKFASNVVEDSIQSGSKEERQKIVATMTAVDGKGQSPLQILITDQFGNYVIRKCSSSPAIKTADRLCRKASQSSSGLRVGRLCRDNKSSISFTQAVLVWQTNRGDRKAHLLRSIFSANRR